MTLYEMTEAAQQLYGLFESGDIPEDAVTDTLEAMGVEGKVEDYCHVINQLNADADMYDKEIKRLQAKKKAAVNGVDRMKKALAAYMQASQTKKLAAGTFTLSFRKSETVVVTNQDALPEAFIKTEVKTTPDKTAIKNAIKSGQAVAGAELQENQNLQIK